MNKRNIFSLLTLMGVATISMAGIFHETDKCHTRVTGRRKLHCDEQDRAAAKERKHPSKGRRTKTKTKSTKENGKTTHYRKEVKSDD
jgi:hypothetical protein